MGLLNVEIADTFVARVPVTIPTANPLKPLTGEFQAEFEFLEPEAFGALVEGFQATAADPDAGPALVMKTKCDLLRRHMRSVRGIGVQNKEMEPAEQYEWVMSRTQAVNAAFDAFINSHMGEAKRGNSPRLAGR